MEALKFLSCLNCGGDVEISADGKEATCKYCRRTYRIGSTLKDSALIAFSQATEYWKTFRFTDAKRKFSEVTNENPEFSEAWWGAFVSEYGIEFGHNSLGEKVPTCHRLHPNKVENDPNYIKAIETSYGENKEEYISLGKEIERIRTEIIKKSEDRESYDVFICFKATEGEDSNRKTDDYYLGRDIYHELKSEGYKVFFSAETLGHLSKQEFEPYIYRALSTAKVMLVLCSDNKKIESAWVKNEWGRFIDMKRSDGLIPICGNSAGKYSPSSLPDELRRLNAIEYDGKLFERLKTKIEAYFPERVKARKEAEKKARATEYEAKFAKEREELLKKQQEEIDRKLKNISSAAPSAGVDSLIMRAFMFLEDGDFKSANLYCEKVLDIDPKNAEAYLGKLMVELKVRKREGLKKFKQPFDGKDNYKKALKFADEAFKNELENIRFENAYSRAKGEMKSAATEAEYKAAAKSFENIRSYKDSAALIDECLEKAKITRLEALYSAACHSMRFAENEAKYKTAAEKFKAVLYFEASEPLSESCRKRIEAIKEETKQKIQAVELKIQEAIRRKKRLRLLTIFGIVTVALTITLIIGINVFSLRSRNGIKYKLNDDGGYAVKGLSMFYKNTEDLVIPDTYKGKPVTEIKSYAFDEREKLKNVKIGNNVTTIGWGAFNGCTGLTSVTIGNVVTSISYRVFANCTGLTSITIHDSVTSIGEKAFYNCTGLTSITIPNSVTSIGSSAFSGCDKLVEVINKSSLTITKGGKDNGIIGYYALEVHNGDSKIVNEDGYLFYTYDGVNYLVGYTGSATELTLPASYNGENYVINRYAFYKNINITGVIIPNSVTSIGSYVFSDCAELKTINYRGTEAEWKAISKGSSWNFNTGSYTINYNYTGE